MGDRGLCGLLGLGDALPGIRAAVRETGFAYLDDGLDGPLLEQLCAEAAARHAEARCSQAATPVAYRALLSDPGVVATGFLRGGAAGELLEMALDDRFVLTDSATCYTYYGPGDHLGPHRDKPGACAATMIVYLDAQSPNAAAPGSGLWLRVYGPGDVPAAAPLAVVLTRPGRIVLGWGSRTWHERPPLRDGEWVVALTACFERIGR